MLVAQVAGVVASHRTHEDQRRGDPEGPVPAATQELMGGAIGRLLPAGCGREGAVLKRYFSSQASRTRVFRPSKLRSQPSGHIQGLARGMQLYQKPTKNHRSIAAFWQRSCEPKSARENLRTGFQGSAMDQSSVLPLNGRQGLASGNPPVWICSDTFIARLQDVG